MWEHNDTSIHFRELKQRLPNHFALFELRDTNIRSRSIGSAILKWVVAILFAGRTWNFTPPLLPAQLVITDIERDAPQPCGKSTYTCISLPLLENSRESLLFQVLASM